MEFLMSEGAALEIAISELRAAGYSCRRSMSRPGHPFVLIVDTKEALHRYPPWTVEDVVVALDPSATKLQD